jgi:alkylation response protein AidB-like acyl-CoA dehydrogenase
VAIEVTQKALFLFGGRGIMAGYPVENWPATRSP